MRATANKMDGRDGVLATWRHQEEGAIALAALAACLVLLMMAAALWDTGNTVRAKTKLQTATDSAAYTQAAIEARTMNFVSFSNIGKRTIVGIHNSYWSWVSAWDFMTGVRCGMFFACCIPTPLPKPCCTSCVIRDCFKNWSFYTREGNDWNAFSGRPLAVPGLEGIAFLTGVGLSGDSKGAFGNELGALQRFQDYITQVTPWWSFLSSTLRGMRNGATVTTSWPLPQMGGSGQFSLNYQHVKRVLNVIGDGSNFLLGPNNPVPNFDMPVVVDKVPVGPSGSANESCHFPVNVSLGPFDLTSTGPGTVGRGAEYLVNHALNLKRSSGWDACMVKSATVGAAASMLFNAAACAHSTTVNQNFRNNMAPMSYSGGMSTSPQNELTRSNIVMGYKHLEHADPNKFAINPEYESTNTWSSANYPGLDKVNHYEPNGVWAMSRAEVTTPKKYSLDTGPVDNMITGDGVNGPWMWTTGWTARIRPMQYQGEFGAITRSWLTSIPLYNGTSFGTGDVAMQWIYNDLAPLMLLEAQTFNQLSGLDAAEAAEVLEDFEYMLDKGAKSMDNETLHAVPK
jgi:hypothetical protein